MKSKKLIQIILNYGGLIIILVIALIATFYISTAFNSLKDFYDELVSYWGGIPKDIAVPMETVTTWICIALVTAEVAILYTFVYGRFLSSRLDKDKKKSFDAIKVAKLMIVSLNKQGTIIFANDFLLDATGYENYELLGKKIELIINPTKKEAFEQFFEKMQQESTATEIELPLQRKDGTEIDVLWSTNLIQNETGSTIVEMLGVNVTKIKDYQKRIHKLAYYDSLTDLPNVTFLEEYVETLTNRNVLFSMLYIDIDNFKFINDTYGHAIGDKLLVEICSELNKNQTGKEFICRIGGDELMIVYRNQGEIKQITEYADFVSNKIKQEYLIDGINISTSASIGISTFPDDGFTYGEMLKSADIAMNKAKELGKAKVILFSQAIREELMTSLSLDNDLKEAVKNNEFILYYQPQYNIQTGDIYGFEALIRWISPTRGYVQPGVFIPAMEKSQLVVPIGYWVLEEAAGFSKRIEAMGYKNVQIAVNVSAVQLTQEEYVDKTIEILKSSQVNVKTIRLEITESVMLDFAEINLEKLRLLTKNGILLALDDFGTGYSSLTYLKRLPADVLKIDKTFVDEVLDESENREIVSSIIDLAHSINLEVVAEGVEYEEQLEWLRKNGCNVCQGYYTGKPVPEQEAYKFLTKNIYRDK